MWKIAAIKYVSVIKSDSDTCENNPLLKKKSIKFHEFDESTKIFINKNIPQFITISI